MEASGVNDVIGPSENTGDPLVQSKWQIIGAISVIEAIGVNGRVRPFILTYMGTTLCWKSSVSW